MSSVVLPQSVNYTSLPTLPDGVSTKSVVLAPVNGSTFSENQLIQFDFNNTGFIKPDSIMLRYKYSYTTAVNAEMKGTPVFTPFNRLQTTIGSSVVENISNFNQVANMLTNLQLNTSQKYGLQSTYGFQSDTDVPTNEQYDGRKLVENETGSFSAPLPCLLSNCEKLIPAGMMPQIRLELTTESIANQFTTTVVPTAMTLSNVELVYEMVEFPESVEDMIRQQAVPKIFIKSQSFANTANTLANATSGQVSMVFNQRLASIKSAFLLFTGTSSNSLNKTMDSYDPTSGSGDFSLTIAGTQYPQTPLSAVRNKAGILQMLRQATGSIYDKNNNFSINAKEFNLSGNTATTYDKPAKFIVGIPLEKMSNSSALLSGISSQNSAISLNINTTTQTAQAHNVHLVLNYDLLLEIDPISREAYVKQ